MEQYPDRVVRQIDTIVAAAPPVEVLKQQYLADLDHNTVDRLDQIQVPTLVTVGSFDVALPPM